jgi:hypothetical protein
MAKTIKQILGAKGIMHKAAGVPEGQKIPPAKLGAMAKGKGPMATRAQLLLKLESARKGGPKGGKKG